MAPKTCMYYLQGNCKYGRKCKKSHDLEAPQLSGNTDGLEDYHLQDYAGAISTNYQPQGLQLCSEAALIKQPNETEKVEEIEAIKVSVTTKEKINKSVKVNIKESPELDQKKQKESHETYGAEFNDVIQCAIDTDLKCTICFEIFIKPTVLNCSHTFCETCIFQWIRESEKCPVCRELIKSKTHCLTLNSFIEKIVEHFPLEIKYERQKEIINRSKIDIHKTISPREDHREPAFLNWEELVQVQSTPRNILFNQTSNDSFDLWQAIGVDFGTWRI